MGLLWVNLSVAFSALEEKPYVPFVTGCILVLKDAVDYIRCEALDVGCSSCLLL